MTWVYSPTGFTMLQALIEDLYGRPFAVVMHDLLLDPLGLTDSSFAQPEPANLVARTAVPYVTDGTPLPDGPRVFNTEASGGLVTSATSLAKIFISFQKALASSPSTGDPIPPDLAKAMLVRQPGTIAAGQCLPTTEANVTACISPQGLGFDTNLNQYFQHLPDNQPTGSWFGQRGFSSGYLTYTIGSKTGGNAVVVMVNVAPEDMSGPVPQASFMTEALERVGRQRALRSLIRGRGRSAEADLAPGELPTFRSTAELVVITADVLERRRRGGRRHEDEVRACGRGVVAVDLDRRRRHEVHRVRSHSLHPGLDALPLPARDLVVAVALRRG